MSVSSSTDGKSYVTLYQEVTELIRKTNEKFGYVKNSTIECEDAMEAMGCKIKRDRHDITINEANKREKMEYLLALIVVLEPLIPQLEGIKGHLAAVENSLLLCVPEEDIDWRSRIEFQDNITNSINDYEYESEKLSLYRIRFFPKDMYM